jgi:RNA recognition motif-containing protein
MGSKLYVGNLSYGVTSSDLNTLFAAHGAVSSAEVLQDRDTGRSKGFGFVQMGSDAEAQAAIAALHGKEHDGRALTVNEARPREERSGGGGGKFGGGRSSGGGGGYRSSNDSHASAPQSRGYVERGNTGGRSSSPDRDGNRRY